LRAQLIEAGHDVVAVDAWPVPRVYFQPEAKPRVVIVDLHELPEPLIVIDELPALAPPERTLVIASLATVPVDELRRRGFQVVSRPATVGEIVARVEKALSKTP
jgi:hypothetical protein